MFLFVFVFHQTKNPFSVYFSSFGPLCQKVVVSDLLQMHDICAELKKCLAIEPKTDIFAHVNPLRCISSVHLARPLNQNLVMGNFHAFCQVSSSSFAKLKLLKCEKYAYTSEEEKNHYGWPF